MMKKYINKIIKRIVMLSLVSTLLFSTLAVEAAEVYTLAPITIYLQSKDTKKAAVVSKNIWRPYSDSTKTLKGIKNSNKKVLSVTEAYHGVIGQAWRDIDETGKEYYGWRSSPSNIIYYVKAKKPGKTKVTFKTNDDTYIQPIVVKKYENPIAYFSVDGGKNKASSFKKNAFAYGKMMKKTKKNATISISTKPNWALDKVEITDLKTGDTDCIYDGWFFEDKRIKINRLKLKKNHPYKIKMVCGFIDWGAGFSSNEITYYLNK